jgi:hypothetical protein
MVISKQQRVGKAMNLSRAGRAPSRTLRTPRTLPDYRNGRGSSEHRTEREAARARLPDEVVRRLQMRLGVDAQKDDIFSRDHEKSITCAQGSRIFLEVNPPL